MPETASDVESMNAERLKEIFQIDCITDRYIEYTPLKDTQAGFSIIREYPTNIRYYPPRTSEGKPDRVALILVVYRRTKKETSKTEIPVFLSISLYSRYFSNHFDYNFDDTNCPTKKSIKKSKSTPKPIDLESVDEYVYDHQSNTLLTTNRKIASGAQILDTLFRKHCNTVHLLKGLKLRWKLGSKKLSIIIFDSLIQFGKWLLKAPFGRILEPTSTSAGILQPYKMDDMKLVKTESFNLLGYKASKNVTITFSILVVAIYIIAHLFNIKFLLDILSNKITGVCVAFVVFWMLDYPVPYMILLCINSSIHWKVRHLLMKF